MFKIIMLSGGSESTALLFKELRDVNPKSDTLLAHHVSIINLEWRAEAEAQAVGGIIDIARSFGDFIFTSSTFEYPDTIGSGYTGMDVHTLGFISGHVAKQVAVAFGAIDAQVLFGGSVEEEDPKIFFNSMRFKVMQYAFKSHFVPEIMNKAPRPTLSFPYHHVSIHDQLKWVPDEAQKLIMSCRRPVKMMGRFYRCGNCYTCQKVEEQKILDAGGKNVRSNS